LRTERFDNYGSSTGPVYYYVFDLMVVAGEDVMQQPLKSRRDLLRALVLPKLADPIRESPELEASLPDLTASVKAQGLEGLVAKRRNSRYEPGQRTGAWQKMRVNRAQEFVIAGYTHSQRVHPSIKGCVVQALQRAGDGAVPVRQPAGGQE
jgi:bifunctional non-homologous end joining protein LigD